VWDASTFERRWQGSSALTSRYLQGRAVNRPCSAEQSYRSHRQPGKGRSRLASNAVPERSGYGLRPGGRQTGPTRKDDIQRTWKLGTSRWKNERPKSLTNRGIFHKVPAPSSRSGFNQCHRRARAGIWLPLPRKEYIRIPERFCADQKKLQQQPNHTMCAVRLHRCARRDYFLANLFFL